MDQYIGKMLDNRYEILERIGVGGMAVVYKAMCHRLNRLVAIKILKDDYALDADFRRRFNAESQAVAQLSHPNIVSVYDVSRGGEVEYIVMELMDGITLKQYMARRGQLNVQESLHFITQIMRGLSHAHSRGIVHRDIKPQNIMVLRDTSVKVADFGIACLENATQTLTQEALGSVHYISPEQARGDRTDARSDIYSAGVVLYEMLTGRLPFEGDSAVSVAIQHLSSIPLAPREINPAIPPQLELICLKAMNSSLERRYQSAEAMIADLEDFRKNADVVLDFDMDDLRPPVVDEPTQPIRTAAAVRAVEKTVKAPSVRERRREYIDEDEYDQGSGNHAALITKVLIVVAVLLAATLGAVTLFRSVQNSFNTPAPESFMVPNVVGLTLEEANALPDVEGIFTIREAGTEFHDDIEKGEIVRQTPDEGEYRKGENRIIDVWISAGEDIGVMPDITNKTVKEAELYMKSLIQQYELNFMIPTEEEKVFDEEVTANYIISSTPVEGEPLKKGDTIRMVVSKGKEIKEYPMTQLVGRQYEAVQADLQALGLVCPPENVESVYSDLPGGEVVWQSIAVNTMVKEGDVIKLQVSSGLSLVNRTAHYDLPQTSSGVVEVKVYVGEEDTPQYNETVKCSDGQVTVKLKGLGRKNVRVYFDGILDQGQSGYFDFE